MKKSFLLRRPLCILLIFALVLGTYGVILLIKGDEQTLYVNYDSGYECGNAEVMFGENGDISESGIIVTESVKICEGYVRAKVRAVGKGEEFISLKAFTYDADGNLKGKNVAVTRVHAGFDNIITENLYRHIYLVLWVLSVLLCAYYVFCFVNAVKTSRFSYDTIFFLSVALFFAMLIAVWGAASVYSFMQYHTTSSQVIFSVNRNLTTFLTAATLPLMAVFVISVSVSNIVLMKKEGFRPANALGIITSVMMFGGLGAIALFYKLNTDYDKVWIAVVYSVMTSLYVLFVILLISAVSYGIYAAKRKPSYDKDFIIILGCKIRNDGSLYPLIRGRVDRAVAFYREQLAATGKAACFVPSGGQGSDEIMPEGEAMKRYLIEQGIPEENIIAETKSATTRENMKFSKEITDSVKKDANIIFSTTSYHVFRSGAIAYSNGIDIDGIGSRTKWYFWPNAFLREIAGIFVSQPKKQLLITLLISLCAGLGSFAYSLF